MSIYQRHAEELWAEYSKRRAQSAQRRQKIADISATAVASREVVKATVSGSGDVTAIDFPTSAYKRMAPTDLASVIAATIEEARAKALAAAAELMAPTLPKGLNFAEMLQGKTDLMATAPSEDDIPDAVRDYIDNGHGPHGSGE